MHESVEDVVSRSWHLFLVFKPAGQTACGEGYLEVVTAGVGVEVEHFSCEIQSPYQLRLHRGGIDFTDRYATCGDYGLFERAVVADRNA